MFDRDALLAAIATPPDEDAPRLALADWLEENGPTEADRARGEFIRLSFARPNLPENSADRAAADARYRALIEAFAETWFAPLPRYVRHYWVDRGFVEGVRISGQQLTQWDRHVRWCPTIRHLVLRACRRRLGPSLAAPLTANVRELDVGGCDTADIEAVAACPHLAHLKVLKLHWAIVDDVVALLNSRVLPVTRVVLGWYGNNFGGSIAPEAGATLWATSFSMRWQWDDLPRLWACPGWARVRELWLVWRQSQNQGLAEPLGEILERAPHLTGVRELVLNGNALDDDQVRALARCPSLGALERLSAAHNRIGDDGVEALVGRWPDLTALDLTQNAVGSRGAGAIARHTTRLERLSLESNNVFVPGMVALARSPRLAGLKALGLKNNPGDGLGATVLADSPYLKPGVVEIGTSTPIQSDAVLRELETLPESSAIKALSLRDHGVTDEGLAAIARNPHLTGVAELDMQFCDVSRAGLDALAGWPGLRTLKTFSLMTSVNYHCCHGADFDELFRSPHWGALEHFKMPAGHRLGDAGAVALAGAKFAPTLCELNLVGHQVTDAGAAALAGANFAAVRRLELGWDSPIGPAGIAALAAAPWPSLDEFGAGTLTDDGLRSIAASPGFARLTKLTVNGTELTEAGARALAAAPFFGRLTHLAFGGDDLTDDVVRALTDAPNTPPLVRFELHAPGLAAAAVERVANWPALAAATDLVLGRVNLDAAAGRALAEGTAVSAIAKLWLGSCTIGDPGLIALARSGRLTGLKELLLGGADCTEAGLEAFGASPLFAQVDRVSIGFRGPNTNKLRAFAKERLGEKLQAW
ncbi:MAG: TIGR02996 domain-containing protein [Planctomycetes bacterium]|nr:TIGR02996 domain-containing protein [Planctomycetota bacterium]